MSTKAGQLLWNRQRITLPAGTITVNSFVPGVLDVDTGLTQVNRNFDANSDNEPGFGSPSRVQVVPLPPLAGWAAPVTHDEPYLDPTTNTIHVVFYNNDTTIAEINALFWDPHSAVGPGQAMTYNAPQ